MLAMQRRRLEKLEARFGPKGEPKVALRCIVSCIGRPLNLETSSCTRWLNSNGSITECIRLDGWDTNIPEEELERLIARFPVQVE